MHVVASLNAGRPMPEIKFRTLGEDVQNITEAARHNPNNYYKLGFYNLQNSIFLNL